MESITKDRPVPEDFNPRPLHFVLEKQKGGAKPKKITRDKFPIYADDPLAASHELLDEYLGEVDRRGSAYLLKAAEQTFKQPILETPIEQFPNHLRAILARVLFYWTHVPKLVKFGKSHAWSTGGHEAPKIYAFHALASALLKRDPPQLAEQDLVEILDAGFIEGRVGGDVRSHIELEHTIAAAQKVITRNGGTMWPELRKLIARARDRQKERIAYSSTRDDRALLALLDEMLGETTPEKNAVLEPGEPWAEAAIARAAKDKNWDALLRYCAKSDGSKPTGKWLKEAKKLVDDTGMDEFIQRAGEWLPEANQPRTVRLRDDQIVKVWLVDCDIFSLKNEAVLKGFAWACAAANEPTLAGPLGALAEGCYKKIPNVGPRSPLVGNACLIALTMLPGREAQAELTRLKAKVKQPTAKKMIEKAIGRSAEAAGLSPDDLEEQAFGTYGLSEVGRGETKLGSFTVETKITGTTKVEQTYIDAKGTSRASVPAELKSKHATEVKALEKTAKDLAKMLPAFRDRLERLPMSRRELPLTSWRQRYLDQVVVGTLARRLIWEFAVDPKKTLAGFYLNGKLVDASGKALPKMDEEKTIVRLWHPSTASVKEVAAWRDFLEKHEITQPFKQAYREVYLLTDAERRTETYSNRFAAHILLQHVFAALCTQRGWKYKLMGTWDGGGDTIPTLQLPRWDMRAEFWPDHGEIDREMHGAAGVATHIMTDQVRFYSPADAADPMDLTKVPPLVFSEVMRDVDLFVGVCSIGNDPNWRDAGNRAGDYWHQYSFGALSDTAQTRREVLQRLIPRLKIADRCKFKDKFLIVRGDLRTYKIHLGSANILMEPNDQYLCIVPDRSSKQARASKPVHFLPFEGDNTLSIIISKALLLAEDTKITDETIMRQIKPRK